MVASFAAVHVFTFWEVASVRIKAPNRVTALDEGFKSPDGIQNLEELFEAETTIDKQLIRNWRYSLLLTVKLYRGDEFWKC
jgi:hypothetical protein